MHWLPSIRHLVARVVFCAVLLVAAIPAGAQPQSNAPAPRPERLSVELGLHGVAVLNYGLDAPATGGGRLTFRLLWPLGSRIRLGLRVGLLLTAMPYGQPDDVLWLGVRPADPDAPFAERVVMLVPSAAFLFQVRIWRGLELDATAGLGAPFGVWRSGDQASQVSPRLGLGLLYYVYRHPRVYLAVRVGFDAIPIVGHPRKPWLLLPMGGVIVRFPVRENPGGLQGDDVPSPAEPHQPGPRF